MFEKLLLQSEVTVTVKDTEIDEWSIQIQDPTPTPTVLFN